MTCKDCIHYFLCANDITNTYEDCKNKNDVEKCCLYFKDKSTTLDLPCKVGDEVYVAPNGKKFYKANLYGKNEIGSYLVLVNSSFTLTSEGFVTKTIDHSFYDWYFNVYTKEEAEKALEELNNE